MHDVDPWSSNVPHPPSNRYPKWRKGFWLLITLAVMLMIVYLGMNIKPQPLPVAKYQVQELVTTVVGEYTGQVTKVHCSRANEHCKYYVRLPALANSSAVKVLQEFEIRKR